MDVWIVCASKPAIVLFEFARIEPSDMAAQRHGVADVRRINGRTRNNHMNFRTFRLAKREYLGGIAVAHHDVIDLHELSIHARDVLQLGHRYDSGSRRQGRRRWRTLLREKQR